MLITIYINGQKRTLGTVDHDKIFRKKVKESKHLFRKLDAWAIDYNAFHNSVKPNANFIEVYDTENKKYYFIPCETFEKKGEVRRYNRNGENLAQIFCSRRHWLTSGDTFSLERNKESLEQIDKTVNSPTPKSGQQKMFDIPPSMY